MTGRKKHPAWALMCVASCLTLSDPAWTQRDPNSGTGLPLPQAVTHAMAGRRGTAVVIDVATGRVLAAYQPNVAARRLALPGSSLKTFTLVALLEAGKLNERTRLMCRRPLTIGAHRLDCTHPDLQQPFDPVTALAYSCNFYFSALAARLTPRELRDSFLKQGFGSPSGLIPGEAVGTVKLASSQADLQMEAIGEWGVHLSPLELLRAYQKLAQLEPRHDAILAPVFSGLEGSVAYGMGHMAQPNRAMKVAGKTGTSLVDEGRWRHGWFAGYAPADNPEIALVVFLERGNGPTDAAGIAGEIFSAYAAQRRPGAASGAGK